jgi:hypothetical protein
VIINYSHYERYLKCPTCGAQRGAPCLSLRSKALKPIYTVHPGRLMRGGAVVSTQHRPYRKHPEVTTGVSVEDWLSEHGENQPEGE